MTFDEVKGMLDDDYTIKPLAYTYDPAAYNYDIDLFLGDDFYIDEGFMFDYFYLDSGCYHIENIGGVDFIITRN